MGQNQHYVSQFYLKYFSEDGAKIKIYNLKRSKEFIGPISTQCAKKNIYANEVIENSFCEFEGKIASILKKIIGLEKFEISDEEYALLLTFILFQSAKTYKSGRDMVDEANSFLDYLKPYLIKTKEAKKCELKIEDLNGVKLDHEAPSLETSFIALTSTPILFDLQMVLMINKTKVEFITSDSPVVLFNSFFNGKTSGLQTGYGNKGLQIFFPITPNHLIFLYDPKYYYVPQKELVFYIRDGEDVSHLNDLQIINCYENVYFRDYDTSKLKNQHSILEGKRKKKTTIQSCGKRLVKGKYLSELIKISTEVPTYALDLSFMVTNHNSDKEPGVRNGTIVKKHRKFVNHLLKDRDKKQINSS